VPQTRRRKFRAMELISDPRAIVPLPLEDPVLPRGLEPQRRAETDAVHPARDSEQVVRRGKTHPHRLPRALLHAAIDVVIAWNHEQAVKSDVDLLAEDLKEVRYLGVLVNPAGLCGVTGEEDEMNESFFLEQRFQIPPPRSAKNTPAPPRLRFLGTLGVKVRYVQKLQAIVAVRHGSLQSTSGLWGPLDTGALSRSRDKSSDGLD